MLAQALAVIRQYEQHRLFHGRLFRNGFKKTAHLLIGISDLSVIRSAQNIGDQMAGVDQTEHADRKHAPREKMALNPIGDRAIQSLGRQPRQPSNWDSPGSISLGRVQAFDRHRHQTPDSAQTFSSAPGPRQKQPVCHPSIVEDFCQGHLRGIEHEPACASHAVHMRILACKNTGV